MLIVNVDPFPSSPPVLVWALYSELPSFSDGFTHPQAASGATSTSGGAVLTCTFLFRLTAGKNMPSTFSNAMGPCCSSLIKNVKVFLFKSRRTPIVAPFVIPPSVLWEKKNNLVSLICHYSRSSPCAWLNQCFSTCLKPVCLNLFKTAPSSPIAPPHLTF